MSYGKFILSLVLISMLLFSSLIAVDEEYMMKRYPNWLPKLPKAENHSYGFRWQGQWFATTSYFDTEILNKIDYQQLTEKYNHPRNTAYYRLPMDSLPKELQEQFGNKLVLTDGINYYNFALKSYGGLIDADMNLPSINLKPVDSLPQAIDLYDVYILLNKNSPTLNTIQPLVNIEVQDSTLNTIIDSLKISAKNKVLDIKHHYIKSSYLDSFDLKFRAVTSDSLPEIFFIYLDGYNLSGVAAYHLVVYCYVKENKFALLQLHESLYENTRYDIKCALNINNDRYIDYVFKSHIGAGIITIRRGQLNYVAGYEWEQDY